MRSLRVENGFGVVKDYDRLLRRQEWTQGSQIFGVFDTYPGDPGEPVEEMTSRRRELVTPYEPTTLAEPLLDTIVMEDSQSD